jgi:hypothetical protein
LAQSCPRIGPRFSRTSEPTAFQEGLALCATLVKKETELRKKNRGTFYRTAGKKRNSSKWRHRAYLGWLNLERGLSEVVLAEVISDGKRWRLNDISLIR